jgi:hypothetical protein
MMKIDVPPTRSEGVRQNYLAILVAAIACFLLDVAWYSFFMDTWLAGIGRTKEWMSAAGYNPALQYGTAIVASAVMAATLSFIVQWTGRQTIWRGVKAGFWLWLGFVLTTSATQSVFEVRPFSLLAVDAGFWLLAMILMGAIVGGWRKKSPNTA